MSKPKVAFIGTGGTISSLGNGPLDLQEYATAGTMMQADEVLARWPETALVADMIPVRYRAIPSPAIGFPDWKALAALCGQLVADHPDLAGIVIGHGTATLEETAYFLRLAAPRDNLAAAFLAHGQAKEAVDRYKSLVADYEALNGRDHPDAILARASLASAS